MHRSHALARYIAWSICTLTVLKFVRKGWQAHCFTGLILTRLASSLPISLLAHRSNKIIHTISYETCGDPSPSCSTNTLLETRIHIHIYTYICPKEKHDVHIRVSTCSYKLGCTHTCMRRVHVRASLAPSSGTSEALVKSVFYHRNKKASQRSPGISPCLLWTRPPIQRATHMATRAVPT